MSEPDYCLPPALNFARTWLLFGLAPASTYSWTWTLSFSPCLKNCVDLTTLSFAPCLHLCLGLTNLLFFPCLELCMDRTTLVCYVPRSLPISDLLPALFSAWTRGSPKGHDWLSVCSKEKRWPWCFLVYSSIVRSSSEVQLPPRLHAGSTVTWQESVCQQVPHGRSCRLKRNVGGYAGVLLIHFLIVLKISHP